MNNRILELIERATYKWVGGEFFDREKFAKLIVMEMLVMLEDAEDDAYHCFEPSERPTEYIEWLRDWQERFSKHFGDEK